MLLDQNTIKEAFRLIGEDRRTAIALLASTALGAEVIGEEVHISGISGCEFACQFDIPIHGIHGDMTERVVNFKGELEASIYNPFLTGEQLEGQPALVVA